MRIVIVCLAVFAFLMGCAPTPRSTDGETVTLFLPQGDPIEGRKVFQNVGCTLCHTATGEDRLPEPSSHEAGPELGLAQRDMSTSVLIEKILNPSHPVEGSASVVGDEPSAMVGYSDMLTVHQLVDLAAYLRYVGE